MPVSAGSSGRCSSTRHYESHVDTGLSRREFLAGASALGGVAIASAAAPAQITTMAPFEKLPPYSNNTLPAGVKPRLVSNVNGLTVNMLEAGAQGRPLVLLLHGFPNLGYSWRIVMPAFADAGYSVIARLRRSADWLVPSTMTNVSMVSGARPGQPTVFCRDLR